MSPRKAAAETVIGELRFQVSPGWSLKNTTTEGLSTWPIAATWDSQNHLVVIESAGVQETVQQQLESRPHRVVRLKDTDRDGVFDKREIIAEQLPFPEGVLCIGNDILVSAPPQIIRLIDADGDGVAESRSVWHDGKTLTGCANDLHGPFLGPDGWLYWCKAAFAEQTPELSGPFPARSNASHLYRKRIDDVQVDRLMTGGMDNLVDVTFSSLGERFFVATFLHHPGGGVRDGLGHAPYGAVYGKPNAVLQGHPRTGPLFEPTVEMGPAAPAGILAINHPPGEHEDSSREVRLIAAQFNLQRVSMHQLQPSGASFSSKNTDLVTSEQLDFHPVDILQDIDGSLLVVDTGGWYDLCCPSSGAEHRVAPGGIYRLSPESPHSPPKSYHQIWTETETAWQTGDWHSMLTSPQQRVREWGVEAWLHSGAEVKDDGQVVQDTQWLAQIALDPNQPTDIRAAAFWAIARWIERHDQVAKSPEIVDAILGRSDDLLQVAALNLVSVYRWKDQRASLENLLHTASSPDVQRLAAECLGRIGDKASIPKLLEAWENSRFYSAEAPDRTLQHAFFYAMLEISSYPENRAAAIESLIGALREPGRSDSVAHACLSTLQQLGGVTPDLTPSLLRSLESSSQPLTQIAEEILANQPECLESYLQGLPVSNAQEMTALEPSLARVLSLAKNQSTAQAWIASQVLESLATHQDFSSAEYLWRWQIEQAALQSWSHQPIPANWDKPLGLQLQHLRHLASQSTPQQSTSQSTSKQSASGTQRDGGLQSHSSDALDSLLDRIRQAVIKRENTHILKELQSISQEGKLERSIKAIAASPRGSLSIDASRQQAILGVALAESGPHQNVAWQAISKIDLEVSTWERLLTEIASLSTGDYPKAIQTMAASSVLTENSEGSELPQDARLVQAILETPLSKTLTAAQILQWFDHRPESFKTELNAKLVALFAPPADMAETIDSLARSLPEGDAFRGQDIYRSSKAACSACHRIGYVGGNLGPELTRIGRSRSPRDLLEAILFPSHRIEQGFSSTSILTVDDEIVTGIVTLEDEQRVEIAVSADKKISVDKGDIQERATSSASLMPAGIDKLLTTQELADLLAFLQQAK